MRRVATLLILLAFASPLLAQGTPKAVPTGPIKNFDIVAKGDLLTHSFEIRNGGDAVLEISNVRPACGCTVAEFDRKIAPGEAGMVNARLDTSDFSGPISKSISVYTNDPENPKLQLVMKAKVQPFIAVNPGFARYVYVQGEPLRPIPQVLWAEDGQPMNVLDVSAPFDYLDLSFHEASEEERYEKGKGRQWVVDIQLKANAPVGALREFVEVTTDHPRQKTVRIPLSGFVRPRQHVTPVTIEFGELQGDALPLQRTFHFTNFITQGVKIGEIETEYPQIKVEVQPSERQPGHRFKLLMTLEPGLPKGKLDTKLRIPINDPQNPVVEVPVKATIR